MGSFTTIEFFPYYTVSYLRRPNQYIPKMDVTDSIESRGWVVSSPLYSEFQVPNRKASSLDRVFLLLLLLLLLPQTVHAAASTVPSPSIQIHY